MDLFQVRVAAQEMFDEVAKSFNSEISELIRTKTYIAGGVFKSLILDEKVNDWDFWFRDRASCDKFIELVNKEKYTASSSLTNRDNLKMSKVLMKTDNAFTFKFPKDKIQFIMTEVGSPKEVVALYDFAHTQSYYDPMSAEMSCPTHKIIGKQLEYNSKCRNPLNAFKRAYKFASQGWSLSDNSLELMIKGVTGLDWKNPEVIKKQTRGFYSDMIIDNEPAPEVAQDVAPAEWGYTTTVYTPPQPQATEIRYTGSIAATPSRPRR